MTSSQVSQSWTHLHFDDRTEYAHFNRALWEIFDIVTAKHELLQNRLDLVAYAEPSNFTRYCRQYLGQNYFDNLDPSVHSESDESSVSDGRATDEEEEEEVMSIIDVDDTDEYGPDATVCL